MRVGQAVPRCPVAAPPRLRSEIRSVVFILNFPHSARMILVSGYAASRTRNDESLCVHRSRSSVLHSDLHAPAVRPCWPAHRLARRGGAWAARLLLRLTLCVQHLETSRRKGNRRLFTCSLQQFPGGMQQMHAARDKRRVPFLQTSISQIVWEANMRKLVRRFAQAMLLPCMHRLC